MSPQKPMLRHILVAKRSSISEERRQEAGKSFATQAQRLLDALQPTCVGAYAAIRTELSIVEQLDQRWQVALPKVIMRDYLEFHEWDRSTSLIPGPFHIPEPTSGVMCTPSIIFVPCLGATQEGWRLGYGAGYYDRFLAEHPDMISVGVVLKECLLKSMPHEPHDIRLTHIFVV